MKRFLSALLSLAFAFALVSAGFLTGTARAETGYKVTFDTDGHASVTVSTTQSFEAGADLTENALEAYARDSTTGEIDTSGSGQVNFLVTAEDGYEVTGVTVTGSYKNLKFGQSETGYANGYRITKVAGDLTVTITTQKTESSETGNLISSITMENGCITSVTFPKALTGMVWTAVYRENGQFAGAEISTASDAATLLLGGTLAYDTDTELIKCFLLGSGQQPLSEPWLYLAGSYQGDGIIHLKGTAVEADGIDGVSVSGTVVTITAAGEYYAEGTLDDGQIVIRTSDADDEVTLNLTDVTVTCSTGNALDAKCGKVTLAGAADTVNAFISTYSSEDDAGTGIYSKNDLTIKGDASSKLIAKSTAGNAIRCKADLEIGAGDLQAEAGNHGIKGDESIKITKKAGTITVTAAGDAMKTDAIDDEGILEYEKGNITINGGTLTLTAEGDGIQADDTVTIAGGSVTVDAGGDGIKANTVNTLTYEDDDQENDGSSVEGNVTVTGGTIDVTAGEDGIKAAGMVRVTGGTVTVQAELDGIQSGVDYTDASGTTAYSAGELTISGGTLNITAGGGAEAARSDDDSHKGIKAYDQLNISGGSFTINSYDDAIHSDYQVTVTGGSFAIAAGDDGLHADYKLTLGTEGGADDDFTIDISASYEGLEGSVIEYLSGTTTLCAEDDGVNAAGDYNEDGTVTSSGDASLQLLTEPGQQTGGEPGGEPGGGPGGNPGGDSGGRGPDPGADDSAECGSLYIRGGRLYVRAQGDGLDSNGNIAMSGGIVLVNGSTEGENGVFDKGDHIGDAFTVTGGTLVGFGTTDMQDNPSVTSYGWLSTTISLQAGTAFSVSTDSGTLVIVPETTMNSALLYVTCADMQKGSSYTCTAGGSAEGAEVLVTRTVNGVTYGLWKTGS